MNDRSVLPRVPRKRVGAGVLLRDAAGSVLLVEPTYKDEWEIPGGLVEDGESPRDAARRECLEELGLEIEVGDLLCVHYCAGATSRDDGVMFVFDAGTTSLDPNDFTLPVGELRSARFVPVARLSHHLVPVMTKRIVAAIEAVGAEGPTYLER